MTEKAPMTKINRVNAALGHVDNLVQHSLNVETIEEKLDILDELVHCITSISRELNED